MDYKKDTEIISIYQAIKVGTGKTIQMDIYDETHAKDAGKSKVMTEIGSTGRYWATWTPDAKGWWATIMYNSGNNKGHVVKVYKVTDEDIDSIGSRTTAIKTETDKIPSIKTETDKIPTIKTETDKIQSVKDETVLIKAETDKIQTIDDNVDAVKAKTDTMEADIRGTDDDDLKDLSDQMDALESPAMVG